MLPLVPLATASIGLQLGGNLLQGMEAEEQANEDAKALEFQAFNAEREGRQMFKLIKKKGESVLSTAQVGLSTSGFRADTAQALEIKDEIIKGVEHDAMNAVLSGELSAMSMRKRAREIRKAGRATKRNAMVGAVAGAGLATYGVLK